MSGQGVVRLVGELDGTWFPAAELEGRRVPLQTPTRWLPGIVDPTPFTTTTFVTSTLVRTGSIEWAGPDGPWAEVWVPECRLELWKAEHAVEEP